MAKRKMNELQVLLINYCADLYVGYQKQAFLELFPIPSEKKTSREQMLIERIDFLNKEYKTRVNGITNLSDADAKAYLERIIYSLEKQRSLAVGEEVKAETSKAKAKVPKAKERGENMILSLNENENLHNAKIGIMRFKLIDYTIKKAAERQMRNFKAYCKVVKENSEKENDEYITKTLMDTCDRVIEQLQDRLDLIKTATDAVIEKIYAECFGED